MRNVRTEVKSPKRDLPQFAQFAESVALQRAADISLIALAQVEGQIAD